MTTVFRVPPADARTLLALGVAGTAAFEGSAAVITDLCTLATRCWSMVRRHCSPAVCCSPLWMASTQTVHCAAWVARTGTPLSGGGWRHRHLCGLHTQTPLPRKERRVIMETFCLSG